MRGAPALEAILARVRMDLQAYQFDCGGLTHSLYYEP